MNQEIKYSDVEEISFYDEQRNDKNDKLTEELIIPNIEKISKGLKALREIADKSLKDSSLTQLKSKQKEVQYPQGFCEEITDLMKKNIEASFDFYIKNGQVGPKIQDLLPLLDFLKNEGRFKRFYSFHDDGYSQNALQIGNAVFDVANDTVDPTKESVAGYASLDESPLSNIKSFELMAKIVRGYFKMDICVNNIFPRIATVCPFLIVDRKNNDGPQLLDTLAAVPAYHIHHGSFDESMKDVQEFYKNNSHLPKASDNEYLYKIPAAVPVKYHEEFGSPPQAFTPEEGIALPIGAEALKKNIISYLTVIQNVQNPNV